MKQLQKLDKNIKLLWSLWCGARLHILCMQKLRCSLATRACGMAVQDLICLQQSRALCTTSSTSSMCHLAIHLAKCHFYASYQQCHMDALSYIEQFNNRVNILQCCGTQPLVMILTPSAKCWPMKKLTPLVLPMKTKKRQQKSGIFGPCLHDKIHTNIVCYGLENNV